MRSFKPCLSHISKILFDKGRIKLRSDLRNWEKDSNWEILGSSLRHSETQKGKKELEKALVRQKYEELNCDYVC